MPVYYHISLGDGLNVNKDLKNNLKLNQLIFFSKKDSKWYEIWQDIGTKHIKSYAIYKLTIPNKLFTNSFTPKEKKIIKVNNLENVKKYLEFCKILASDSLSGSARTLSGSARKNITYFRNNNIIGFDFNSPYIENNWEQIEQIDTELMIEREGFIDPLYIKNGSIKCEKVSIYKNGIYKKI